MIDLEYRDPRVKKVVLELLPSYIQENCSCRVINMTARAIYEAYKKGLNEAASYELCDLASPLD